MRLRDRLSRVVKAALECVRGDSTGVSSSDLDQRDSFHLVLRKEAVA